MCTLKYPKNNFELEYTVCTHLCVTDKFNKIAKKNILKFKNILIKITKYTFTQY